MAEAAYTHKVLTIKCCIDSYASTIKKNPTNIKVKSGSNDDYFANLMTKVRKKFKFLDNLDDSEWDMKIGGDIVEKGNGDKLKEILQRIPPVPVIQIVKTQISEDRYVITLHFGDQKFDYPLTGAPDDWNEDIYTDLVQTIRDKFNLQSEFALYEDCGGSHVDMDGMDDIADSFDETDDISKAMPDMVDSKGLNVLHLFIRQESQNANQFKIMVDDGSSFFEWIPPNAETDDEKEWESNYDALLNDIAKRYNFDKNDIELQQDQDGAAIDVEADDLSEIWQELVEDDTVYVAVLSSNVTSSNCDIEPGQTANNPTDQDVVVENGSNKSEDPIQDEGDAKTQTHTQPKTKTVSPNWSDNEGDGESVTSQYKAWFDNVLRLAQHYQVFVDSGYKGFEDLKCDLDQQLIDIGIRKKPHRKRILKGINDILNNKQLFTDIQACDFDKIAKTIHALGGVDIVNHFKSPFDDTKERIWMRLCRANDKVTAQQKLAFLKRFETEFRPNFDLTDGSNGNVIHVLCGESKSVKVDTASLLLEYFVKDSKCISKDTFVAQDAQGRTSLHCAVINDKIKCVQLLLPLYTDDQLTQLKDANGKSIVDLASKHQQIKQILPKTIQIDGNNDESDEMKSWLENTVKLPQYYQLFIEAGYEDMSYLDETIEDRDLMEDVGITVQSHRETILNAIKSLLQPHARPETDDQLNEPVVLTDELKGNESENDDEDVSPIVNIVHVLVDLGSIIGTFTDSKKKSCHGTLVNILDEIKLAKEQKAVVIKEQEQEVKAEEDSKDDEEDEDGKRDMELKEDDVLRGVPILKRAKSTLGMEIASTLKTILEPISKTESAKFIDCIVSFLQIIGFEANHVQNKGFEITGASDQKTLDEVVRNFYYLCNAMQKPKMNVYQQLNIKIPNDGSVVKHKSGLYDNEFITFLLPQIVMENQQSSLVNKVTLDPEHLERFINFLVPNSSKYLCREIYFEKLIPLKVSAIGLFGSRKEVLCMLMKYKSISKALYDKLIDDETNAVLSPGIHGIVPVNLQQDTHMDDWDRVIYLFYWSLPSSFDMVKMKGVKNMRRDPACLLSRVLYEISSTVAIMVSSSELHDFGVVKHSGKKIKKQKRTIRRVKLVIEETKENHIMCLNQATPQKEILTFSDVHNRTASDLFLFGGPCLTGWCQLYPQKERVTQKRIRWDGSTKEELTNKIKALNTKYMIELDYDLPLPAQGIVIQSLMPDQYADYKQKIDRLKVEEDAETAYDKIKQEAESIIAARNAEILQGFFNQYNTKQNCQEHHSAMCAIMQELGNDIEADIATAAVTYASMEFRNPSQTLPKIEQHNQYKIKNCLKKITKDLQAKLDTHVKKMAYIQKSKTTDIQAAGHFAKREKRRQEHTDDEETEDEADPDKDYAFVGKPVDIFDPRSKKKNKWYTGSIVALDVVAQQVKVHYDGWDAKYDQFVTMDRVAVLNTYTAPKKARLKVGNPQKKKKKKANKTSEWIGSIVLKAGMKAFSEWKDGPILTDKQIAAEKKKRIATAKRVATRELKYQRNQTLKQWIKTFEDARETYRFQLYFKITSLISVTDDLKLGIRTKYDDLKALARQELIEALERNQSTKPNMTDMLTIKVNGLRLEKSTQWKAGSCLLVYFVPDTIKPSYAMQFVSIDLPNMEDEMRTQTMKNMHYEMPRNCDLIFHHMMDNGDTVMFIRGQDDDTKTQYVDVVASEPGRRTLMRYGSRIKRWPRNVQLVSYCESQSLFAILFDDQLAFAKFEGGIRLTFTNKNSDLTELYWWNCLENKAFQAMFIQEIDKNIFVWFIDQEGVVRAYDYDANSWDSDKEFDLDQKYESYILSPAAPFLVAFKPQFKEDCLITRGGDEDAQPIEKDTSSNAQSKDDINDDNKANEQSEDATDPDATKVPTDSNTPLDDPSSTVDDAPQCNAPDDDETAPRAVKSKTPTGRIQLHAWLLSGKKKLEYKIHTKSTTGYETDHDPVMDEDNRDDLDVADNVLLPESFTIDMIKLNQLNIQHTTTKNAVLLTAITRDNTLLYHPLQVQVSDSKLKINKGKTTKGIRKTTKLDYMEYMVEKFGSRAAVCYPPSSKLLFHTTYIMKDECKDALNLCDQIAAKIQKSLYEKESKDFKHMSWECAVIACDEDMNAVATLKAISNKETTSRSDEFMRNLIVQIPIQIARGEGNQFLLMYNGKDDQSEYTKEGTVGSRSLCKAIRFSAYDGLIKSWPGKIKVVTSMGKQSTGKSYMLNHLFGTKFDISGGRCTDGAWLSARVVHDTLYIICDFEGLGSFERSAQEDMLLATFNAAVSNCTIFKCDNRFDRSIEDMFSKFQAGVKIMKGSERCFAGELMLIVKDVIETGADAAVEDFMRHIERLAQSSQLVTNDKGEKESPFFVYQMYKGGLAIIPYPPLANEAFFTELDDTLHPNIVGMESIHKQGGKIFLDHIKLIMAKLNIGDYAAMSGEQAKIRATELKENLQNAVETGSIIKPKSMEYGNGVTFQVDDDQNLLLLDENKVIAVTPNEAITQINNYTQRIDEYVAIDNDIENTLITMVTDIGDAGIILGRFESLKFLWQQFSAKIKRVHASFKETTNLFELFLDIIYHRRKLRVNKYITDNTKKFEEKDKMEIDALIQSAESRLNMIRDKMRICKFKCADCFYPCLLCKNHEDHAKWADRHSCFQNKHNCKEICEYCAKDGKSLQCDDKCGHSSKHNCRQENHTCGNDCSLIECGGCQERCNLESGHDKDKEPCKCNAETHYCKKECAVGVCHNTCKEPYNKKHDQHICIQSNCPYQCEVKCWNDALGEVANCGRPCDCNNHAHDLEIRSGECKDKGHICDKVHPCPALCTENGLCHVEIKKTIVKKETFIGGAGTKFEYDSYADVNAKTKRCCKKIPIGQFEHAGDDHKCYDESQENVHTCDVACDTCGYYCEKPYGHPKKHNGQHGNMRNTKFYASDTVVDTGDGRIYQIGDKGVAEICNIFCQRMGRGHTHLEFCEEHAKGKKCVELKGIRHQRKPYKPDEDKEKDEVMHSKFWSRKGWDDPCKILCSAAVLKSFDKCPYVCAHPSHEKKKKEKEDQKSKDDEEEEEEKRKYCSKALWHPVCDEKNGCQCGTCHAFQCKHPFSKAHVIFVGDCSGSMTSTDNGKSEPQLNWIRNAKQDDSYGLVNRLGALYEAIYKFNEARSNSGCRDVCSVVMFETDAHIVARRQQADVNFVRNHILPWKIVWGCTSFYNAFSKARDLVDYTEETVMIFLTDGEDSDGGASKIVRDLKNSMKSKFSLYCITLAASTSSTVRAICTAGKGVEISDVTGIQLGSTFVNIAKKVGGGGFM